jgi:hypothetical protein
MPNWQQIERAPKDGTVILCLTKHGDYEISHWDAVVSCWVSKRGFFVEPALWMPLPLRPGNESLGANMEAVPARAT